MSTSRDVLKFEAAAAVTGMVATEFAVLPEADGTVVTLIIDDRHLEVRPLSFSAALPAPYQADLYVWGYHVGPAVQEAGRPIFSAESSRVASSADGLDGQVTATPILRQHITIDEGMYSRRPASGPIQGVNPVTGRTSHDEVGLPSPPMVRLARPISGAPVGGMTPDVAREVVLVEVEKHGGPMRPALVNSTRWDDSYETVSAPTEIWEGHGLTEDFEQIHLVRFQFVGNHGLDADAYQSLHDLLFPGVPYPHAAGHARVVAARGSSARSGAHVSGFSQWRPAPESYFLASPRLFGNAGAGVWNEGSPTRSAFGDAMEKDIVPAAGAAVPFSLSGFDPAEGPGYVWHCHVVSRHDNEVGSAHRFFSSPPTTS